MKNTKTLIIKRSIVLFLLTFNFVLSTFYLLAQSGGVAINSTGGAADNSAMLDVSSINQGMRIPRVALTSTTSSAPITNPVNSLLVYDSATVGDVTPGFYYWDTTTSRWIKFSTGSGSGWLTSGNAGTDSLVNFIGTTDAQAWVMKTDNTERMKISKNGNIGIGTSTPSNSAILDVSSTTKGLRMPNMTTIQRNAISSPATGLQIYNTDCNEVNYYNGSCWIPVSVPLKDPGHITTDVTAFCANTSHTYSIAAVPNAIDYVWSVPAGASITSGQGSTSATVLFGNISGDVCVYAYNNCETSPVRCIEVNVSSAPGTPGNITGPITAVPGQTNPVSYSIASMPGATTYNWTVPPGASITSGTGTTNIVVNYSCSTTAGYVAVSQTAACGTSTPASLAIAVNPLSITAGAAKIGAGTLGGSPTATGGYGTYVYAWSPSIGLSATNTANPTANACITNTYTLTVTDINTCSATSSVTVTKNLTASAGSDQTGGNGGVIGGSPTAAGGIVPYLYAWSPSTGLPLTTVANPIAFAPGTTTYSVTVTDANGCTASSSMTLTNAIPSSAPSSCQAIKAASPSSIDGVYWIKPASTVYQCYCDMTSDGGGWTLVENTGPKMTNNGVVAAVGTTPVLPAPTQTTFAKLTDTDINLIRGTYATSIVKVVRPYGCNTNTIYFKHDKVFNSGCTTGSATISNYYISYANAISNTSLQTSSPNGPGGWTEALDSWSGGTVGYQIIFNYGTTEGFINSGCDSDCSGCSSACNTNRSQCNVLVYVKQP